MTLLLVSGFMQQAQPPTFRTSASILPVDVRVIDKSGKAVTDLTKANFTVSEDGVPQTITQFEKDSGDDPTHPVLRKVVEAPGVAPGSEHTSPQESTCVAVSEVSRPTSRSGQNRRAPVPENLAAMVRDGPGQPAY